MGRLRRIQIPDITFHVVQRGHDRARVFHSEGDYRDFLFLLNRVSRQYDTSIHAYVLMTNHVHLLMTSKRADGISRTMQHVAGTFARRLNERRERSGALWESRFKSSPVDTEFYCLACYRYIELNPVRAGMVSSPADYRWSSYHENIGRRALRIIEPHPCFTALGASRHERAESYRALVGERLPDRTVTRIRSSTSKCIPIGHDKFRSSIEGRFGPIGQRDRGRPAVPQKRR